MKAWEFILEERDVKGTYAGVHFSEDTKDAISAFIKENNIPNPTPRDKLHTTLLYSRKPCPNYVPQGNIDPPLKGKPSNWNIWQSQPDSNGETKNCLVLEFTCPELTKRHKELMDKHNATFDHPEYKTHITFSYDVGDISKEDLPLYDGLIEIVEEYAEDLNLDWAKNNGK